MSDLLAEADRIAMNSLLAALCDPGRFVDRAPLEPLHSWQRRAVIEHAAPYILAVAEKRAAAAEGKLASLRTVLLEGGQDAATVRRRALAIIIGEEEPADG